MKKLLSLFLAGITAILPLGLTVFILYKLFMIVDSLSAGIIEYFYGKRIIGLGFLTTIVIVILIGFIARNYLGQKIIGLIEKTFSKIPIVQSIYSAIKEVSKMFSSEGNKAFSQVVSVDFPYKGIKSIGFITNDEVNMSNKEKVAVFIPTTPNPTNGFLIYVSRDSIEYLDMSIDEAIRAVVSLGAISPKNVSK